jgi:hypothetical protein
MRGGSTNGSKGEDGDKAAPPTMQMVLHKNKVSLDVVFWGSYAERDILTFFMPVPSGQNTSQGFSLNQSVRRQR